MIRPPSLCKKYDAFFSGDEAFKQPPPAPREPTSSASDADRAEYEKELKAHEKRVEDHVHAWKVARETGDYGALLSGDGIPTKFVMEPMSSDTWAVLIDMVQSKAIGDKELSVLSFRAALVDVVNFGDVEVKRETHPKLGKLANLGFFEAAGVPAGYSLQIIVELGRLALSKAQGPSKN